MLTQGTVAPPVTIPGALTAALLERAANPVRVVFDRAVLDRVADCRTFMVACLTDGRPVYGTTTGFGPLLGFPGRSGSTGQCDNVLCHLTAGQGEDLEPAIVRATMLARLWSLSQARSGVSRLVLEALAALLGTAFAPAVPRLGSVGASGDLIPLAYLARALRGEGHAWLAGERLPAREALRRVDIHPLTLTDRDALGLVNGTSLTAATAGLAVVQLQRSHHIALVLTALLAEILGCDPSFTEPALLRAFGHPDVTRAGETLRENISGTHSAGGARPLQEPYSIRCSPQLLGAAAASLRHAGRVIHDDLNGISDNPLFFAELDLVAHGGNFFSQPVAFVADLLTIVATQIGNLAERQLDLLVDPHRNGGLPPMLASEPGQQHGLQGVQLAATAIVAAMRRATTPASVQSLPTNLHNQDIVPFGTQAALNALDQVRRLRLLHGSLAVALRQAVHIAGRAPAAARCLAVFEELAGTVPPVDPDRPLDEDVRKAADLLDAIVTGWRT
jgi:histidine ammonia-lyase